MATWTDYGIIMPYGNPNVNRGCSSGHLIVAEMSHKITLFTLYLSALVFSGCRGIDITVNATAVPLPNTSTAPAPVNPANATPLPTATEEPCDNDAVFMADLTIPDFSELMPGQPLRKSWQIRNTGSCSWGPGYHVVFKEGNAMTPQLQHALYPARPETNAVVQIDMNAPEAPGDYQGFWRLYDPDGNVFGHKLFIKITVVSASSDPTAP